MENKKKQRIKHCAKCCIRFLLIVAVLCATCINAFAMPTVGEMYYPAVAGTLRLGVAYTGVATGQYFLVPDAFACNYTYSAEVIKRNLADNGYIDSREDLSSPYIYNQQSYSTYSQIQANHGTGCLIGYKYNDPYALLSEDVYYPLYYIENVVMGRDNNQVIWINTDSDVFNDIRFMYICRLSGYDPAGQKMSYSYSARLTDQGSSYSRFDLMSAVETTAGFGVQDTGGKFQFDGNYYVDELSIVPCTTASALNVGMYKQYKINWIRCYATYYQSVDDTRESLSHDYFDSVMQWVLDQSEGDNWRFVNSNWFTWIGTTMQGILNVRIFGPDVNFTLGGILGSVIAIGFVGIIIKMLRG